MITCWYDNYLRCVILLKMSRDWKEGSRWMACSFPTRKGLSVDVASSAYHNDLLVSYLLETYYFTQNFENVEGRARLTTTISCLDDVRVVMCR